MLINLKNVIDMTEKSPVYFFEQNRHLLRMLQVYRKNSIKTTKSEVLELLYFIRELRILSSIPMLCSDSIEEGGLLNAPHQGRIKGGATGAIASGPLVQGGPRDEIYLFQM